jgi:hypothetical protein
VSKGYKPPSRWAERLRCLFPPTRWGMMTYYSPEWDHYMRMAITMGMVRPYYYGLQECRDWLSDASVEVGPYKIWVGNYPFAYGYESPEGRARPSFATMRLLKKEVRRIHREHEEKFNA